MHAPGLTVRCAPRTGGQDGAEEIHGELGFKEIERLLAEGRGVREIARALNCSRDTVRQVRDGRGSPERRERSVDPLWMAQLDWPAIIHDLGLGHPLKFIWEEKAQSLMTYSNFWKQFYRKFPQYRQASITARDFEPGERVEVDYAGDTLEWIELSSGEVRKAYVFVAGLGFSQLLFAWACEDMKSRRQFSMRLLSSAPRALIVSRDKLKPASSTSESLWDSVVLP
jgi:transposase